MAGSATQANIKSFVDSYAHLPSWAQPGVGQAKGGGAAGLPPWAQKPGRTPSAFSQPGGGVTPQQAKAAQQAQAQAAKTQAAQTKAANRQAAAAQKVAQQQGVAAQKAQAKAAQQSQDFALGVGRLGIGIGTAGANAADSVSGIASGVTNWVGAWPTPGGIGLLLIVIFVLLWALIPVDKEGYTRLQLLWFTVMGRTQLQGGQNAQNAMTVARLADTTSPLLGVTSLAQNVQNTTQDFSISPGDGSYNYVNA